MKSERIALPDTRAVGRLRERLRYWTKELDFPSIRATKVLTAASELARNTVIYGGGGEVFLERIDGPRDKVGIRMRFVDQGPGIADLELAFTDGYTSGSGLGLGLSGTRRLLGDLSVDTSPAGTTVEGTAWRR